MAINIRQKGASGEREVLQMLNKSIQAMRESAGLGRLDDRDEPFQRNQNQTAVGGSDISNPFKLEIEVKRQEALSINTWWKQTLESSNRTGGVPILIFKQNRKKWRVIMMGTIWSGPNLATVARVEISVEDFLRWFEDYFKANYDLNY